jgi:hypothetical protein
MSIWNSPKILGHRFEASKGITEESNIPSSELCKFTFWLTSLIALLSFSAGIFCLQVTRTPRTTDLDQERLTQSAVSLTHAMQALSTRN